MIITNKEDDVKMLEKNIVFFLTKTLLPIWTTRF
jgi:hypothetical protein